jgi:gas vesicle protein GvpA/GvpJ/GvpM family
MRDTEFPIAEFDDAEHLSLCEALDRILNKGAVVTGDLTISVADIDLIYVGLRVLVSSAAALNPARAAVAQDGQ